MAAFVQDVAPCCHTGGRRENAAAMHTLTGSFSLMTPLEVVDLLARRRASGNFSCERGSIRKTVQVVEGIGVGAVSNDPREYLGQLLMNFGQLTEEQLTKAFQTQLETRVRLGQVLTMVGLVSPEVVRDTLALKIRETLLDAFTWDSGTFRVEEAAPPPPDELAAAVPLADVVREAEFRSTAWEAFRARFPSGAAPLVVEEGRIPPDLPPGGVDARLLRLAREGLTIDEIGLALHATDFHLHQRLFALAQRGILYAGAAEEEPTVTATVEDPADALAATTRLRSELLDPPRIPHLKVKGHEVRLMRLSAAEKYLLGRCDGTRDLKQILQLAPLAEGEVLRAMERFVEGRIVELG